MSGLPPRRHLRAAGGASAVLGGEERGWGGGERGNVVLWLCSHRNASVAIKSYSEVLLGETATRVRDLFLSRLTLAGLS